MSYDLTIYVKRELPADIIDSMRGDIYGDASVDIEDWPFELDGPSSLEPEDVPEHIAKVAKGLRFSYRLGVPYSAPGNLAVHVDSLTRFARAVADAGKGVWVDEQSGEVWRGERRIGVEPQGDEQRIDTVEFDWYVWERPLDGAIDTYVEACSRHLPEALPRRYGSSDPLQHKFESGLADLKEEWRTSLNGVWFTATTPCLDGNFPAWAAAYPQRKGWHPTLSADRRFLQSPLWRERFLRLFVQLAEDWGCFYASAEVMRDYVWARGSLWADNRTERSASPMRSDEWCGLPPYPVWWSYFGMEYSQILTDALTPSLVTETASGLLYQLSDGPLDRDSLSRSDMNWVPRDLTYRVVEDNPAVVGPKIAGAPRIPHGL